MELRLCYLEPNTPGENPGRSNLVALVKRCLWRGIDLRLAEVTPRDDPDFRVYDVVLISGRGDAGRHFLFRHLPWLRQSSLTEAVEEDVVVLALGGAYQLMGRYHQGPRRMVEGLGLFDLWTEAGAERLAGPLATMVHLPGIDTYLVGHESHRGRTWLGPRAKALGRVLTGSGNNGVDGTEGAVYKNLFGSYLLGPLLPKNPEFVDYLFQLALERKYHQEIYLPPMPNLLEDRAHQVLLHRLRLDQPRSSPQSAL